MSLHDNEDNDDVLRCGSNLWVGGEHFQILVDNSDVVKNDHHWNCD